MNETLLVNGISLPTMEVAAGQWYRWRVLFVSAESLYNFQFSDPSCELELIAKVGLGGLRLFLKYANLPDH